MHTAAVTVSKELEGMVVFQHVGIKKQIFFWPKVKRERKERKNSSVCGCC